MEQLLPSSRVNNAVGTSRFSCNTSVPRTKPNMVLQFLSEDLLTPAPSWCPLPVSQAHPSWNTQPCRHFHKSQQIQNHQMRITPLARSFCKLTMDRFKLYAFTSAQKMAKRCRENSAVDIGGFGLGLQVTNVLTSICLQSENKAAEREGSCE